MNSNKRVYDYIVHCLILISFAIVALYLESLNASANNICKITEHICKVCTLNGVSLLHTHLNMLISFTFCRRVWCQNACSNSPCCQTAGCIIGTCWFAWGISCGLSERWPKRTYWVSVCSLKIILFFRYVKIIWNIKLLSHIWKYLLIS